MGCKSNPACVVDDGKQILNDIADADAIILGTPVYGGYRTGQMKLMVDRLFSFMNLDSSSKLKPGKKALWAVTQSTPNEDVFMPQFEMASGILQRLGCEYKILVAGGLLVPGELLNRESAVATAYSLGEWLVA